MILRLQTEQDLELLQSRIKAKSKDVKVHVNELRTSTGTEAGVILKAQLLKTPSKRHQDRARATFEHKLLSRQLTQAQIPYREEFRFEAKRRWKADFLVDNFLVEIVGGLWMKRGGHSQGQAQLDDMEKFNHAAKLGFRVLQFSPDQVRDGEAIGFIEQVLA